LNVIAVLLLSSLEQPLPVDAATKMCRFSALPERRVAPILILEFGAARGRQLSYFGQRIGAAANRA
jgi:hypothetical protein